MPRSSADHPAPDPPGHAGDPGRGVGAEPERGAPSLDAAALLAVVAALPDATAVFAVDAPRFTLLAASDALVAMTGRSRATFVGRALAEAFPGPGPGDPGTDGPAELRASLEAAVRTGVPQRMARQRYDLQRPDGTWEERYWDAANVPVAGPDGAVRLVLHRTEDVTERVLGDRAAVRSEVRAARILEQVGDAHVALDSEFRIVHVNAAAERVLGRPAGEMLGRTHWDVFPASVDSALGRAYRRVVAEGVAQHVGEHYVGDGYDRHLEIDAYPTEEGGVAVFWRDVTERVHDHAAVEALRTLIDLASDGYAVLDREGRYRWANHHLTERLGHAAEELRTLHVWDVDPHFPRERYQELFDRALGERLAPFESEHLRGDGSMLPVEVTVTAAELPEGPRLFAVVRDISERRAADAERARLLARAEAARAEAVAAARTLQEQAAELEMQAEALQATAMHLEEETEEAERARQVAELERARAAGVLEAMADAYVALDADFRITEVNAAMERGSALPRERLLGRSAREVFPGMSGTAFERRLRAVATRRDHAHYTHAYSDGRLDLVVEVDAYPGPGGGVVVFWRDVTARARAEAALRESEARYRELFTAIDEGFCVIEVLFDGDRAVDYRFVETNPAFVAQSGLADAVGRTARELVPTLEQQWFDTYGRIVATGESTRFEMGSDVMGRWFDVFAFRVGRPEERRVALLFTDRSAEREAARERERLTRELAMERERLAYVFRQAPSFLAVMRGPRHVFTLVNETYYQLVGHRDILGKPAFEALPEMRPQGFEALLDRVLATGEPYIGRELPLRIQRTPGAPPEERYVDLVYMPLVEAEDGAPGTLGETGRGTRVTGVIAHGSDVTPQVLARREVERLLAESEQARRAAEQARADAERSAARTAGLQAATAALAAATSLDDVAYAARSGGAAALGATAALVYRLGDPALGEDPHMLHSTPLGEDGGFGVDIARTWQVVPIDTDAAVAEVVRTGAPIFHATPDERARKYPHLMRQSVSVGFGSWAMLPLVVEGRAVGALVLAWPAEQPARAFSPEARVVAAVLAGQCAVSLERVRLYAAERVARERAEDAVQEAEEANQAKSSFLATMSHELRTPINAMLGYTQLLDLGLAGPLTAQQRDYLDRLAASSQHLLGLVNDVLDLSRIEAGETHVAHRDAWTGPATRAGFDLVRPQADAKGVHLVADRATEQGVPFVGDEDRVRQIVVNLLSNAVKFTESGGTVTVACESVSGTPPSAGILHGDGPWAFVRVTDTGVGIPPEEQGRIFEPFHQVDRGHTRRQGGTGLGLAISRRLARLMAGDLTVESTPGVGSTFTLWLPAARRAEDGADAQVETAAERGARAEHDLGVGRLAASHLGELGELLHESSAGIVAAYAERLRADPAIPLAREMRRVQLEDHTMSLCADLAQSLVIVADAGVGSADLLRDGSAIQRTIADAHGARRYAQGWEEDAVRRELRILREEVVRAIRARIASGSAEFELAMQVLLRLVDRAEAISVAAWQRAAAGAGARP